MESGRKIVSLREGPDATHDPKLRVWFGLGSGVLDAYEQRGGSHEDLKLHLNRLNMPPNARSALLVTMAQGCTGLGCWQNK